MPSDSVDVCLKTTDKTSPEQPSPDTLVLDLVSNETLVIFSWICFAILGQLIAIFGTCTNIINIICFVKQGFKDPINISLLGMSVSDLCSLLSVMWTNICCTPAFYVLDMGFSPLDLQYLIGTWPHITFSRVTTWITAFITVERCLCVTMPLKVKTMITPKRVGIIIVSIFVIFIISVAPIYCVSSYGMMFSPVRNKTILGLIYTPDREQVEKASFAVNNVCISLIAYTLIVASTICLVANLKLKSRWRTRSTSLEQAKNLSNRDQKISRMIIMISVLFIACFFPVYLLIIAMIAVPQLSLDGNYSNTLIVVGGVGFFLETTNSAMNIFIYYHMSSRYRAVFRQVILCRNKISVVKDSV